MDPIYESYKQVTEAYKAPPAPDLSNETEFMRYWAVMDMSQLKQMDNVFRGKAAWVRLPASDVKNVNECIIDVMMSAVSQFESYARRQHLEIEDSRKMKFEKYTDTAWDDHGHRLYM